MTLLVDSGLPGSILYGLMMILAVKLLLSIRRKLLGSDNDGLILLNAAIGGSLASIAVEGMFSALWRMEVTFWCLAMLMILVSLNEPREAESVKY